MPGYQKDIAPIMNRNCAVSGCHAEQALIGNFRDYQDLKLRIDNGKFELMVFQMRLMPPDGYKPLTENEKRKLRKWIDGGAMGN